MVPESLLLTFPMVCYNSWFLNFKEFLQAELHADVNSKVGFFTLWDWAITANPLTPQENKKSQLLKHFTNSAPPAESLLWQTL